MLSAMAGSHRITMGDLAKRLGVSRATVSKAMNPDRGRADISDAMRRRVREAAQALGYQPEADPRWSGHDRLRIAGLVYGRVAPYFGGPYARLYEDIPVELARHGWGLQFTPVTDRAGALELMRRQGLEAVIVVQPETELVDACLEESGLPAVALNLRTRQPIDCVLPDDRGAAERLGSLLAAHGHRHVAFVALGDRRGRGTGHFSEAARRSGLASAMSAVGGTVTYVELHDDEAGQAEFAAWLRRTAPTAVFAYHFEVACRVYRAAATLGWSLPRDLSVVAGDGTGFAALIQPALTSAVPPLQAMARTVVERLLARVSGDPSPVGEIALPSDILELESVAPARSR